MCHLPLLTRYCRGEGNYSYSMSLMMAEDHDDDNDGVRNMETIYSEMSTQVEGYLVNWNLI